MRPKNDNHGGSSDYSSANGDNRRKYNGCDGEDGFVDSDYKIFLENLKENGNRFVIKAGERNGSPLILKYEFAEGLGDEQHLGTAGKRKNAIEADKIGKELDSLNVRKVHMVENSNASDAVEKNGRRKSNERENHCGLNKCDREGCSNVKQKKKVVKEYLEDMIEEDYFRNCMVPGEAKNATEAYDREKRLDLANIGYAYKLENPNALDAVEKNRRTKSSNRKVKTSGPSHTVSVPYLQNEFSNGNLSVENYRVLKSQDKRGAQGDSSLKCKKSVRENLRTVAKRKREEATKDLEDMIEEDYEYYLNYVFSPEEVIIISNNHMEDQNNLSFLDDWQKERGRKITRTMIKRKKKEAVREPGNMIEEDYKYVLDNLDKSERGVLKFNHNGLWVKYEDDSDSEVSIVDCNTFEKEGVLNPFIPSKGIYATVIVDDGECPSSLRGSVPSQFREKLLSILKRPYDQSEYNRLSHDIIARKPIECNEDLHNETGKMYSAKKKRKSYLDHYSDFRQKLKAAKRDRHKKLNLLRGFFFYFQNIAQAGAFVPWKDKSCLAVMPASSKVMTGSTAGLAMKHTSIAEP